MLCRVAFTFVLSLCGVLAFPGVPGYGGGGGGHSKSNGGNFGVALAPASPGHYGQSPSGGINFGGDSYEDDDAPGVGYIGSLSPASPTFVAAKPKRPASGGYGGGSSSFSSSGSFSSPVSSPVGLSYGSDDDGPTGYGNGQPGSSFPEPSFGKSGGYGIGGQGNFGGAQPFNPSGGHQPGPQFGPFNGGKGFGKGKNKGPIGGYGGGAGSFGGPVAGGFDTDFSSSSSSSNFGNSGPAFHPNAGSGLKGANYGGSPKFSSVPSPVYDSEPFSNPGLTGATYGGSPSVGFPQVPGSGCCGGKKNKIYPVPIVHDSPVVPAYVPSAPAPKRPAKIGY